MEWDCDNIDSKLCYQNPKSVVEENTSVGIKVIIIRYCKSINKFVISKNKNIKIKDKN